MQRAVENGRDERSRVAKLEPFTDTVRTTRPACIQQPHIRLVLFDAPRQPIGVDHWRSRQERPAEAGTEVRLRLRHPRFRPGKLARIPVDEVVHRLLARQFTDRRQHAERIGGQKHHVLRMRADRWHHRPRNI